MGPRKQKNRDIVVARSGSNSENTHTSDEDFPAGVGLSPESGSQEEFTSSSNGSYDDEEHIPGEWDPVDDFEEPFEDEELTPSDSASRPSGSRKHRTIPSEVSRSHRKSRRAPVEEAPLPPRQSRSRKVRDPREYRRRTTSVESDSLDSHDDYPYPGGYGRAPPHPSAQWGHVPHATGPQGYASSSLVSTAYPQQNPFTGGGMPPPGNQLVPFSQQDGYGYPPHGHNPFFSPTPSGSSSSYFGEIPYDRRPMDDLHRDPYGRADVYGRPPPRDRSFDRPQNRHRHSVHGPPHMPSSGYDMMPYGGMYPGYPPHMPPYYPHHHSSGHTPPSKKATPAPVPDIPAAIPTSTPVPVSTPGPTAEDDRIAKLEALLQAQLKMQEEKAEHKKRAAEQAARLEAEAKKKGDEDKLAKLEKLILAQKAEQIAREKAADAKAEAARKEADAKAAKEAADKKAAEEEAARLVDAAKKAREEAEAEAQKKADDAKAEHEKAIAEAKKAADEAAAAAKKAEEEKKAAEAALKPPPEDPKAPIKFKDAVGRKFSFPWHICKTWKGMEDLIKQAFLHVDVIGMHVQEGHYDLVGPNGEIILPQVWETMIQPDWAVTMHMWPMPEPPPGPDPKGPPPPGPGGDPFIGMIPPITKKPSKGKGGKKVAPPPPPPPPPPVPGAPPPGVMEVPPVGGGPDIMVVEPKKSRPQPKKVNSGLSWFAGGGGASKSLKGPKRSDGSSVTAGSGVAISRAHAHDQEAGCLMM